MVVVLNTRAPSSWLVIGAVSSILFVCAVRSDGLRPDRQRASDKVAEASGDKVIDPVGGDHPKPPENVVVAQCGQREEDLKRQLDLLADKFKHAELDGQRLERELRERPSAAAAGACSTAAAAAATAEELLLLREKLANCGETVKAVRERCDSDQAALKQLTKEHATLSKTSGNCTEKLKECDTQKSYLEFLKKGYDVVVQDLEKETKAAKENKEKSDKHAKEAIKGASKYRTYLVASGIIASIVGAIKLYQIVSSTLRQRTEAILEAKSRNKSELKKTKRK